MPFLRYANARVVKTTNLNNGGWDNIRVASGKVRADRNLVTQASKILGSEFDPSKYLLTHATIVASVDTVAVPGEKIGSIVVGGKKVVRKTASYRVKPECDIYINNNLDAFSRPVLLKSYPTFIGGHSFLEHVQIEELSKGRILDAVARDIGDSLYVDILVANDRKHTQLIEDIESGRISTLSMGCSIDGSICTKCGNWAADETEMCTHVLHEKGNTFFDESGRKHRIAELCGYEGIEPTGGVKFIEASWVEVPAFKGAVARNVISISSKDSARTAALLEKIFTTAPPEVVHTAFQKVARDLKIGSEDEGYQPDENPFGEPANLDGEKKESPKPSKGILDDAETELTNALVDRVKKRVRDQLQGPVPSIPSSDSPNDTIIKQGGLYRSSLRMIVATAKTTADVVRRVEGLNTVFGISVPQTVYSAALRVGPSNRYGSFQQFLDACGKALNRAPTSPEIKSIIRIGAVMSAHQSRLADGKQKEIK